MAKCRREIEKEANLRGESEQVAAKKRTSNTSARKQVKVLFKKMSSCAAVPRERCILFVTSGSG